MRDFVVERREQKDEVKTQQAAMQQVALQLEILGAQSRELQRQQLELAAQIDEVGNARRALADIKKVKAGNESLVPLGAGVFALSAIKETGRVLANVGGNIILEKTVDDAASGLEAQEKSLRAVSERITLELGEISQIAESLYARLQAATASQEK